MTDEWNVTADPFNRTLSLMRNGTVFWSGVLPLADWARLCSVAMVITEQVSRERAANGHR